MTPRRLALIPPILLGVMTSLGACGGQVGDTGSTNPNGPSTNQPGPSNPAVTPTNTPVRGPNCPNALPSPGTPCSLVGVRCEYGEDPTLECNALVVCSRGKTWSETAPPAPSCGKPSTSWTHDSHPEACPTSLSNISEIACKEGANAAEYVCQYPAGRCKCGWLPTGAPVFAWSCDEPPAPGCPAARPLIGTACPSDGKVCTYGSSGLWGSLAVACTAGAWQDSAGNGHVPLGP